MRHGAEGGGRPRPDTGPPRPDTGPPRPETGQSSPKADRPAPSNPDEARRSRSGLNVIAVVAAAARAGRRDWWRILPVALVVCILTAVAENIVTDFVDRSNLPVSVAADLTASGVSLLGAIFLSGFLCRLAGGAKDRKETASVRTVFRTLAWRRLVSADLLVTSLVVIGLIALVIPGLIAANLFAVVGPVIDIEDQSVIGALRRSAHLVRRHFWTVALLVTLPVAVASEIEAVAPDWTSVKAALETILIRGLCQALIEAAIGLITVQVCYRLIALDRAPSAVQGEEPGSEVDGPPGRRRGDGA